MTSATLLVRADASINTGTGHVMRCLALAQAWQDAGGGRTVFAMVESTPAIQARLLDDHCEVVQIAQAAGDAGQTIELARTLNSSWVVVDGYQFDADYQRALKAAGLKILFLDDYGHAQHYSADVVLNQNLSAAASLYARRELYTHLLLGPRYALLRREFAAWRDWEREIVLVARRVLVMMGGSDPANLTACVIEALALAKIEELEATVVVGGSNPHAEELQKAAARSGLNLIVRTNVTNPAEIMAKADIAVSASGSTVWELCMLGLPVLLVDVAANQTALAKELARRGCAIHIGDQCVSSARIANELQRLCSDQQGRRILSERSQEFVDGKGAPRVVSVLRGIPSLRLRPARRDDRRLLWEWANDPEVRAASFSPDPIPWETHVAWFDEKIESAENAVERKSLILIAEDEDATPIGQIRFDARPDGEWDTDVSIARAMRGRGMAGELIKLGLRTITAESHNQRIHAFVKPGNAASVKAFERAGLKLVGTENIRGHAAIHLVYLV
jgi:UDP-2,4-diacetamido-2,4,6-trideoxy-beta-L-altropyranose hydrolase